MPQKRITVLDVERIQSALIYAEVHIAFKLGANNKSEAYSELLGSITSCACISLMFSWIILHDCRLARYGCEYTGIRPGARSIQR